MTPYTLIVAATKESGIGIKGGLPWRIPKDMVFFKHVTTLIPKTSPQHLQNVVIMGRVTWESIPPKFRPLTDRFNIVISRNPLYDLQDAPNTVLADSFEKALSLVDPKLHGRVFVVGGAHMYQLAIKERHCSHILLTRINSDIECDTFFPNIDEKDFRLANHQELEEYVEQVVPSGKQSHKDIDYEFLLYIRK
ncbi:dihydrofolate reductase [Halteromyces radiatus]|uniref:dihydrofolate reductase n=1 Tax=Halteromyces radiatus TaxID=101107 RepID=UPI00221EEEBC|nr:dihydrofolate reductase [Halteromyces radiatus]KAI8081624.1 dihydrofolate reductase [Halteromyces radiatus]